MGVNRQGARAARVACVPGLESVLCEELTSLGLSPKLGSGGCLVEGTATSMRAIDERSYCADRVYLRLGRVSAASLDALAAGIRSLPWRQVVDPRQDVHVVVRGRGKHLRRGPVVVRKVHHAIQDALRGPRGLKTGRPPGPIDVLLEVEGGHATVWADASGGPLHRRGWRPETAKAPLRETVASAVLYAAGWRPGVPLVDPMCGAGTFGIEAARQAAGLPPRLAPSGAWRGWPMFRDAKGKKPRAPAPVPTVIQVSDRDPGAVQATHRNAARAGVEARLVIEHTHLADRVPTGPPGVLVANPPWGRRLASPEVMHKLAASWRRALEPWADWTIAWLVPDPALLQRMGGGFEHRLSFRHGGIPVTLGVRSPRTKG